MSGRPFARPGVWRSAATIDITPGIEKRELWISNIGPMPGFTRGLQYAGLDRFSGDLRHGVSWRVSGSHA